MILQPDSNTYLQRAEQLMEINRFSEAILILTKILGNEPDNYDAMRYMAFCYLHIERDK
jgi:Tfp pilus assembly protein PilF